MSELVVDELAWADAWMTGRFRRILETMRELRQKYPGTYRIQINTDGDGALIYEDILNGLYAAADFDDGDDMDVHLKRFSGKVAALFE